MKMNTAQRWTAVVRWRRMANWIAAIAAGLLLASVGPLAEGSVLVSQAEIGFGYGFPEWDNFSAALDAATGNQVTVVPNFSNLAQMFQFDALLLDQRVINMTLGANEASNIAAFAATGRRVLMMGENDIWTVWDNQILAIVGSSFAGTAQGQATRLVVNPLTAGAPTLTLAIAGTAGLSAGGTPLYAPNFATLWGPHQNVLTVLDVNVWQDDSWNINNGGVFGTNVANWLASAPRVPEPCGFTLTVVGAAVGALRSRHRRQT
jgi:hypothetical protein